MTLGVGELIEDDPSCKKCRRGKLKMMGRQVCSSIGLVLYTNSRYWVCDNCWAKFKVIGDDWKNG